MTPRLVEDIMFCFYYPWCSVCKDNFPMQAEMYNDLEDSGDTFYCPKGHPLMVHRTTITSEMRYAKRASERKSDIIDKLEKRTQSLRGVLTRYRNRLQKGVCPYCGESAFIVDLIGHINDHHKSKNQ